jgi:hypothetical protein
MTTIAYAFEPVDYETLLGIEKRLHGDGTVLTSDARRDLANLLSLILHRAQPLTADDLSEPIKGLEPLPPGELTKIVRGEDKS